MKARILLNEFKIENYNFIDYEQMLFLDLANPIKVCEDIKLTNTLRIAIVSGKVIDVDNVFKIKPNDAAMELNQKFLKHCGLMQKIETETVEAVETKKEKPEKPKKEKPEKPKKEKTK